MQVIEHRSSKHDCLGITPHTPEAGIKKLTMAQARVRSLEIILQDSINFNDREWSYNVPTLPKKSTVNNLGLIKAIAVVSNSAKQTISLRFTKGPTNRATVKDPPDCFISISFSDFRLRHPIEALETNGVRTPNNTAASFKESLDYVVRLLRSGVTINGVHYNFYGHSNSQLKSKTCILFAGSRSEIVRKVEELGDFAKIKSVAKMVKRIGLLFSAADMASKILPDRCEDIPDITNKDYNFTDGCGLISGHLARLLVKEADIKFRNRRYMPSVFQVRYRGYKGVVMLEPSLKGKTLVKFRDSMKNSKEGMIFHSQ